MKHLRYIFFFIALVGLSGLYSCKKDDPSLASTLSGTWTIQQAFENGSAATFSTSSFSLVLNVDGDNASTYTLNDGGVPMPDFSTSGDWVIGSTENTVVLGSGSNAITAALDRSIPTITIEWTDDRDKTAITYQYILEKQ